jgi:hypothetical protein
LFQQLSIQLAHLDRTRAHACSCVRVVASAAQTPSALHTSRDGHHRISQCSCCIEVAHSPLQTTEPRHAADCIPTARRAAAAGCIHLHEKVPCGRDGRGCPRRRRHLMRLFVCEPTANDCPCVLALSLTSARLVATLLHAHARRFSLVVQSAACARVSSCTRRRKRCACTSKSPTAQRPAAASAPLLPCFVAR